MNAQRPAKNLLIVALVLLIAGFAASAAYWSLSERPAYITEQESYGEAIAEGKRGEANRADSTEATELMNEQWERVTTSARLVEAHGHFLFLCVLLLLFSTLMAGCSSLGQTGRYATWLAVGGILIYPAGLIVQATGALLIGQIMAAGGALMIIAFAAIVTLGVWRHEKESGSS